MESSWCTSLACFTASQGVGLIPFKWPASAKSALNYISLHHKSIPYLHHHYEEKDAEQDEEEDDDDDDEGKSPIKFFVKFLSFPYQNALSHNNLWHCGMEEGFSRINAFHLMIISRSNLILQFNVGNQLAIKSGEIKWDFILELLNLKLLRNIKLKNSTLPKLFYLNPSSSCLLVNP